MSIDEKLQAFSPITLYLATTKEFLADIKTSISDIDVEILDEDTHNEMTILKIKAGSTFQLFTLGAFVQLEREMKKLKQKMVDDLYKDTDQLS